MENTYKNYLINVREALQTSLGQSNVYVGRDGALRLAREIGFCLNDFNPAQARLALGDSYNLVCVMGYDLQPPLDKKDWDSEVISKISLK
ncbi:MULTISPECIES: hypothetical protein [Bacillus amyloliquefaciens group]|uniref:hypothetical protein n=1 Tax=Bacillus amyloliquefaciens group TaxID=1938374 RepID=UPI00073B0656|nr:MULTISPECIES: hypothetical protein [Bacillus amyloliquefaciens group]KTF59850.1 hypothetical protein AR691_14050 [Bacillus amyloliquefaciens]